MTGVIQGGWGFVWTAYGMTAAVFVAYGLSVILRYRSELRRAAQPRDGGNRS